MSHVKFDAESNGDTDLNWKPQKPTESDLSQNIIILKNNHGQPISSGYGCSLNLLSTMLSDNEAFFIVLSWLYYRYWNTDLENTPYRKLLVSSEYNDYCYFKHHFHENVEFGATKNSRDFKRNHYLRRGKRRKSWKLGITFKKKVV